MNKAGSLATLALLACATAPTFGAVIADFEGSLDGFVGVDTGTVSLDATRGSQGSSSSMKVVDTATGWGDQTFALDPAPWADLSTPGATLQFDVMTSATDTTDWFQIFPVINSENSGWQQGPQTDITRDGQWHTYTWALPEVPSTAGNWQQLFFMTNGGSTRTFWVDNIATVSVPEPASLSLIGLGGLALLRRRRA